MFIVLGMYNFAAVLKERPELVARTSILWRSIMIGYRLYHITRKEGVIFRPGNIANFSLLHGIRSIHSSVGSIASHCF